MNHPDRIELSFAAPDNSNSRSEHAKTQVVSLPVSSDRCQLGSPQANPQSSTARRSRTASQLSAECLRNVSRTLTVIAGEICWRYVFPAFFLILVVGYIASHQRELVPYEQWIPHVVGQQVLAARFAHRDTALILLGFSALGVVLFRERKHIQYVRKAVKKYRSQEVVCPLPVIDANQLDELRKSGALYLVERRKQGRNG